MSQANSATADKPFVTAFRENSAILPGEEIFGQSDIAALNAEGEKIYRAVLSYGNLTARSDCEESAAQQGEAVCSSIEHVLSDILGLEKDVDYRLNPQTPAILLGVVYGDAYFGHFTVDGFGLIRTALQLSVNKG